MKTIRKDDNDWETFGVVKGGALRAKSEGDLMREETIGIQPDDRVSLSIRAIEDHLRRLPFYEGFDHPAENYVAEFVESFGVREFWLLAIKSPEAHDLLVLLARLPRPIEDPSAWLSSALASPDEIVRLAAIDLIDAWDVVGSLEALEEHRETSRSIAGMIPNVVARLRTCRTS